MTIEEAKKLDHFVCAECSSDDDVKKSQNGFTASPADDVKVCLPLLSYLLDGYSIILITLASASLCSPFTHVLSLTSI